MSYANHVYRTRSSVLQPSYVGEEVFDVTHKVYYRSTGLTINDWAALN
jgi:hypothetical protein